MNYGNGRNLSLNYNNRMFLTRWNVQSVLGFDYEYQHFSESTSRVTFARNLYDSTLDRSWHYDHVGRLISSHSGSEARAHIGQGPWEIDGPYSHNYGYDKYGNMTFRVGWGGWHGGYLSHTYSYSNNKLTYNPENGQTPTYDAAGNLTYDGMQNFTYDVTGQQTWASATSLAQAYDGDRLRVKKTENGVTY